MSALCNADARAIQHGPLTNTHTHHADRTPPALTTSAEDSAAAAAVAAAAAGNGPN